MFHASGEKCSRKRRPSRLTINKPSNSVSYGKNG
jgi:hypothetical protein